MRVLHVLNELRHSGAETALARMAPHAAADGVEAEILAVVEGEIGAYAPHLESVGYRVHSLRFSRDAAFPARALAFCRANRFAVVHVHCERASFWLEAAAWASGASRIVRTVNGLFGFEGGLRARRKLQRAFARSLFGVETLAASPDVARNEALRFGNPATVTANCVDVDAFRLPTAESRAAARAKFGLADANFCVAIVGACDPVKGHDVALAALARAVRDGLDLRVLHAGSGPTEAAERAQAVLLGIPDRVSFLGPREDVPDILAASDAFLMPSRVEPLGLAAVEAVATGLRCVLADTPGMDSLRAFGGAVEWAVPEVDAVANALLRLARIPDDAWRPQAFAASNAIRLEFSPAAAWRRLRPFYGF